MWAYFQGHWGEAIELYAPREIRERMGDPIWAAVANENIAEILIDQGGLDQAEALLQAALRVVRASGWREGTATATKLLGKARSRSGRFDEAFELLDAARSGFREVGAQSELNETEAWIAECHLLHGDSEAALSLAEDALSVPRRPGASRSRRSSACAPTRFSASVGMRSEGCVRREPRSGPEPSGRLRGCAQSRRPQARQGTRGRASRTDARG